MIKEKFPQINHQNSFELSLIFRSEKIFCNILCIMISIKLITDIIIHNITQHFLGSKNQNIISKSIILYVI